jgi:hypothetical protein
MSQLSARDFIILTHSSKVAGFVMNYFAPAFMLKATSFSSLKGAKLFHMFGSRMVAIRHSYTELHSVGPGFAYKDTFQTVLVIDSINIWRIG